MLNTDFVPTYVYSSFRKFQPEEKHITRVCEHDVLLMMFEGKLRFDEDGVPVEIGPGEFYIQRRGMLQTGRLPSDEPRYYYIHFLGDFSDSVHGMPLRGSGNFSNLIPLFKELDWMQILHASAVEKHMLFLQILSELNQPFSYTEGTKVVQKLISAVFQDLQHSYSLDELANMCGYSKNYVIRLFRQVTGKTPYNYITGMKIDMAKRLILNSEMSIEQIAIECGFGTYTNFYKAFNNVAGCSPLQYRNNHQ